MTEAISSETVARLERATSFDEAQARVEADECGKWDVTVPRQELLLRDGRLRVPTAEGAGYPGELMMTPWATAQFCQRLGIPTGYFRKCPTVLQDMQANYWIKAGPCGKESSNGNGNSYSSSNGHKGLNGHNGNRQAEPSDPSVSRQTKREQWLLRARHGTVRGVLSQLYSPLDNGVLLERLQTMVEERYRVGWFALDEESLHLRLIDPNRHRQIIPGDEVMAGVHVSNSEVGKRAVTVDAMVFRLVCTNGLIALVKGKSLLHQRHIHLDHDQFSETLEQSVQEAFTTADGFLTQMQQATHQPVPKIEKVLEHLAKEWSLGQSTQELMQHSLLRERSSQQHTVYGLANALTFAAQSLAPDTRYDLEVLAGRLIENGLPRRWTNDRDRRGRSSNRSNGSARTGSQARTSGNGQSNGHMSNGHIRVAGRHRR